MEFKHVSGSSAPANARAHYHPGDTVTPAHVGSMLGFECLSSSWKCLVSADGPGGRSIGRQLDEGPDTGRHER